MNNDKPISEAKAGSGKIPLKRLVIRPGSGWKQLKRPVWEHCNGVRIHVSGLILRDIDGKIHDRERMQMSLLHRLIKINGGNKKRGLMAFAMNNFNV
jgi:hypothetical protein